MSWEALGVIASLVYLALQIRQNTRSTRATAFQTTVAEANAIYRSIGDQADSARIFFEAMPGVARFWQARGGVFRRHFQELVARAAPAGFPSPGLEAPAGPPE